MCLGLERDHALYVLNLEEVACRLILGCKLLHDGSLSERHVVLVSRENLVRVLVGGLLDHLEERALHLLTVDDERAAEDLMTAVLRVDLCETKDLAVGQRTAYLLLHIVEILDFFGREGQTFLLVILFEVFYMFDGLGLMVHGEHILVQPVIHALKHGVVVSVFRTYGEVFLYTRNAVETHVLCNLYGICAPRSDHLTARSHEESVDAFALDKLCLTIQPAQFINFILIELMVNCCCYHALLRSPEEKNHISL